ncbi:MAG: ABC transporter ATP-binding protein [Ethanoligenens sp.]
MSYLSIQNVQKSFQDVHALKGVSLEIKKGEFVTLLGSSGCGKSTLLRIIAGLETKNSGDVFIDGRNLEGVPANKRNLGMVFQQYSLFPNMTVLENVSFGLRLKKKPAAEISAKAEEMLGLVGLKEKLKAYPDELSGGQQQRVALARSLVMEPNVLLLDEPLSALDAKIRLSLRRLIREIQKKMKITTIFVTHDQEEALSISDRIFVMEAGEVVQSGTPQEIYKHPRTRFVASFLGTYNFLPPLLFGENGSEEILIRPEHIKLLDAPQAGTLKGIVQTVFFLGNYSRLDVQVGQTTLLVDILNTENLTYQTGDTVYLSLPPEKRIYLQQMA